jgi:hypothetical protein
VANDKRFKLFNISNKKRDGAKIFLETLKKSKRSQAWWYMPVIPGIHEAETEGL